MGVLTSWDYSKISNTVGELSFGEVASNNTKFSAFLRNQVAGKECDHYVGLVGEGKMAGSTLHRSPSMIEMKCGDKPVDGQAGLWQAKNGDIMIGAPRGRIRIFAADIEIIAKGGDPRIKGTQKTSGHLHLEGLKSSTLKAGDEVVIQSGPQITMSADKLIGLNCDGVTKVVGHFKNMTPEAIQVTVPPGTLGTMTIEDWIEVYKKTIQGISPF